MSSTLSTPKRTGSRGRSSSNVEEKPVEIDYQNNADAYFSKLNLMHTNAETIRKQDSDQTKTLMEYLPINDKFNLNKEGKVIARWQERQRDWEQIQSKIQRKLTSKIQKPLMMATTDEYRARIEEYDLLQAAIPLKDRISSTSWQVMLRGGGPYRVAIGHIFSGIECEVDMELPKPKMVRKPKPMQAVGKNDTFLDQTSNYLSKVKKYEHTMKEIRPHNLTYGEAGNLVLRSVNLFTWAKESSAKFFEEKEVAEGVAAMSLHEVSAAGSVLHKGGLPTIPEMSESVVVGPTPSFHGDTLGPKIDFLSSKEVIFDAVDDKACTRFLSFRNTGSVAVTYKWCKVPVPSSVRDSTDATTLNGVLNVRGVDGGALRARNLSKNRDCFFCMQESGQILPEETVSTTFTFRSCTGGGSFHSEWILEFYPDETAIYQVGAAGVSSPGPGGLHTHSVDGTVAAAGPPMCVGTIVLQMKGHSLSYDESVGKRAHLEHFLDQAAITAVARDVVFSCLRRVRDPVRLKDLQDRQIALFRRANAALLNGLSPRYTHMLPLFITPERLEMFVALYQQVSRAVTQIRSTLSARRAQYAALPKAVRDVSIDVSAVDLTNPLDLSPGQISCLREAVFPEEIIEIFDEVTEDQLLPAWSYELTAVFEALNVLLVQGAEVGVLEEKIAEYAITAEKARLKVEKLAARAASKESDDEEEEEEEEEEDDEDRPPKLAHPFVTQVQALEGEIHSTLFLLLTHPLPEPDIYEIASSIVGEIAESIVDHHETALVTCELASMVQNNGVVLPALPSPFTSPEGHAAWAHALAQSSHIAEPEGGGKKAPPKPAKGAPPPSEPTRQQIDYFYKLVHDGVRTSFLDHSMNLFSKVDERLERDATLPLKKYQTSLESLFNVATVRPEDCEAGGKIAFVSFQGSAFTDQDNVRSAFDVKRSSKVQAVAPVLKLAEFGAKAIVLVYESPSTLINTATDALLPYFEEIKALVLQLRGEYVARTTKALRKLKQKPPAFKELVFAKYASFAEFYYHSEAFLKTSSQSVPIILIENAVLPGVVPPEPVFVEEESDDEAAPVALGIEESGAKKRKDFDARRPHRVQVTLDLTAPQIGAPKRNAGSNVPPVVRVECFADAAAAITEAYTHLTESADDPPIWVEGAMCKLFDPLSVLPGLDRKTIATRFASESVREAFLWSGVLQLWPQRLDYLNCAVEDFTPTVAPAETDGDAIATVENSEKAPRELIAHHLAHLFPYSATVKKAPKAVVVLGGSIRADKFVALDQLIDLVDTIFIVGELALPFLCLSKRYLFSQYALPCAQYHAVCSTLLAKARMRGCQLRWPSDMLMGDLEVTTADRLKCFVKFEADARNEGADYDGEAKVFRVSDAENDTGGVETVTRTGFAYDIGTETIAALKASLQSADLVVAWGTVGVCESGAFQAGQQCLVEFGSTKVLPEPPAAPVKAVPGKAAVPVVPAKPVLTKNPLRTVLIGDACVEWFTRILDSDGELDGDLVGAGVVTYTSRESTVFAGLMGLFPSRMAQAALTQRVPREGEFVFSVKKPLEEESDDEDEDEEEEGD